MTLVKFKPWMDQENMSRSMKRMFGEINLGQTVAPTIAYKFGALSLEEGDFKKSIAHLSEAQRVYEMRGQKSIEESISEVIALLGRAHFRSGNLDQAKLNLTDAIKYPKDNANRRGHAWAHLDLALIEVTEGQLDKAKEYLNKALSVVQHHYRIERELIEKRIAEF